LLSCFVNRNEHFKDFRAVLIDRGVFRFRQASGGMQQFKPCMRFGTFLQGNAGFGKEVLSATPLDSFG
jgi:hypothetical protein